MSQSGNVISIEDHFVETAPFLLTQEQWTGFGDAPKWQAEVGPDGMIQARRWACPRRKGEGWGFFSTPDPRTAHHSLEGREGWLLGYDNGEFEAGGLFELNSRQELVQTHRLKFPSGPLRYHSRNVRGLCRVGDCTVVLRGLNHLGTNNGTVELYSGEIGTGLTQENAVVLPGTPGAFAVTETQTVIATIPQGLVEIEPRTCSMRAWAPSPSHVAGQLVGRPWATIEVESASLVEAHAWPFEAHHITCWGHELYVGAGPIIIRLRPHQDGFRQSWLVHRAGTFATR